MSRTRYDFKEATFFLNECVSLDDLRDEVCSAMHNIPAQRLSKKKKNKIWHTLLTCADFLDTISLK